MRLKKKNVLAVTMSIAMVVSVMPVNQVNIKADTGLETMMKDAEYNLSLNKGVIATTNSNEGTNTLAQLVSGSFTTSSYYSEGWGNDTFPISFTIDLGEYYEASGIDELVLQTKNNAENCSFAGTGYEVSFSADGLNYKSVVTRTASQVKKLYEAEPVSGYTNVVVDDISGNTDGETEAVRYVKISCKSHTGEFYGWQTKQLAVLNKDGNAVKTTVEKCDNAAGIEVKSDNYNTIKYKIIAGENQEKYKYMVYLDNTSLIGLGVDAGIEYKKENVQSGEHTLKVVAVSEGKVSDGIESEKIEVEDISALITNKKNIANKNNNPDASVISVSSFYSGHSLESAQTALDGKIESGENKDKCLRTGVGSPQSFIIDLGGFYKADEFDKALIAYTNNRTYAADTTIEFSNDGITFEKVAGSNGYVCKKNDEKTCDLNIISFKDLSSYKQQAVRYVRVKLSSGASAYGYVVNEFGLSMKTENPTKFETQVKEAKDIVVSQKNFEKFTYKIEAGDEQEDYTYIVRVGSEIINAKAIAGVEYKYDKVVAGDYILTAYGHKDGWISKGISKKIKIDGYANYIATGLNLAYKNAHGEVVANTTSDNLIQKEGEDISAGVKVINDGIYTDRAHHTGYLQTYPKDQEVTITYDLGKAYVPKSINNVISIYEAPNYEATEYEILFSGDNENYESVFEVKNRTFETMYYDKVNTENYTQQSVRYVKYIIKNGNHGIGYHLLELAVMGDISMVPKAPENVNITANEDNKIKVSLGKVAEGSEYVIYVDGKKVKNTVDEETVIDKVKAGKHTVSVSIINNGIESEKVTNEVVVKGELPTQKPTQKPTEKPTQKPNGTTTEINKDTTKNNANVNNNKKPNNTVKAPAKAKITKVTKGKKKAIVQLKKVAKAKGYVIQYADNRKFKKAGKCFSGKQKITVKKLKAGKKYYFRAKAYVLDGRNKVYSTKWSNVKSVTISKK